MYKKYKMTISLLLLLIVVFVKQLSVTAGELNFTIEPIFPENQVNKSVPYFDLRVEPGQKQKIEVEVTNSLDKEITVLAYATTAKTNANGIIEYKDLKKNYDQTLKIPFTTITRVPNRIVLKAKEKKRISIEVDVPMESFQGMILGGLYFKEEASEEQGNTEKGMDIKNSFSYVITVKLTENDEKVEPEMKLLKVKPTHFNGNNVLEIDLQNTEPIDINQLKLVGEVYRKKNSEALYSDEKAGLRMAPNSTFGYMIPLEGKAFVAGKYELNLKATTDENEWEFKKEFEITKEEANKLNLTAVGEIEYEKNYWFIVVIVILILLCLCFVFYYKFKKRKKVKKVKRKRKNSSSYKD